MTEDTLLVLLTKAFKEEDVTENFRGTSMFFYESFKNRYMISDLHFDMMPELVIGNFYLVLSRLISQKCITLNNK